MQHDPSLKMKQKRSTNHGCKFSAQIETQNDVNWPKKIGTRTFFIGTRNPKDRDTNFFYRDTRISAPLVQGTSLYKGFWKILVEAD